MSPENTHQGKPAFLSHVIIIIIIITAVLVY
jgi:hypothetical protein